MRVRNLAEGRGELIDIGGRRLRVVRAGVGDGPLVVLEHGAFGCAADWAEVQAQLAAKGIRSLSYDRAGLGFSDPGPGPRDADAIADDLDALLAALGEAGPYVLTGHSMGGLMVRVYAGRHPQATAGLVLVDAVTPEVWDLQHGPRTVRGYGRAMKAVAVGARFGLMRPVAQLTGNLIGLTGEAAAEKRYIYGLASHAAAAASEVASWPESSREAAAAPLSPELPVAAVTAGAEPGWREMKALQAAPANASRAGYVEHVAGANHASLLGARYATPIVRGVEHVLAAFSRARAA